MTGEVSKEKVLRDDDFGRRGDGRAAGQGSSGTGDGNKPPQVREEFSLSGAQAIGVLGMSFFWTWFFMVMFSDSFLLPLTPQLHIEPQFREMSFLAMACCFASVLGLGSKMHTRRGFACCLCVAIACSPWAATYNALAGEPSLVVEAVIWAMFGIAAALLLGSQSLFLKGLKLRTTVLALGCAATLGGCLYFALSYADQGMRLVCADCLPVLTALCLWSSGASDGLDAGKGRLLGPDPMRHIRSSLRIQPAQPFYGLIFSLVLSIGISTSVLATDRFPLGIALAFCLAGPVMFGLALFPRRVDNGTVQWFLLPVAVVGLMFTVMDSERVVAGCGILLAFCYSLFDLLHTLSLVELMREQDESTPYVFASGKLLFYGGAAIGWGVALPLLSIGYHTPAFDAVVLAVASVVVITLAVIGRPSRRASSDMLMIRADDVQAPSLDDVCRELAVEAGLSPRQTEVFFLLARGRNAPYIEEELVISYHTVKAHVYRIYQKLDVHSHQELIDKVEDRLVRNGSYFPS